MPMCDPGEAVYTERMTKGQEKMIKKKTRSMTPEANWFAIWHVLFPHQKLPASPCESFSISSFDFWLICGRF